MLLVSPSALCGTDQPLEGQSPRPSCRVQARVLTARLKHCTHTQCTPYTQDRGALSCFQICDRLTGWTLSSALGGRTGGGGGRWLLSATTTRSVSRSVGTYASLVRGLTVDKPLNRGTDAPMLLVTPPAPFVPPPLFHVLNSVMGLTGCTLSIASSCRISVGCGGRGEGGRRRGCGLFRSTASPSNSVGTSAPLLKGLR
jgi:hypothetical protein